MDVTSEDSEKLEHVASNFLSDEIASSDSHDEDRPRTSAPSTSCQDRERRWAASIRAAMSSYKGRDRVGSFDSTRSEDGVTCKAINRERAQNNGDGDVEKRLKGDKERAIAVLKRVHPSRICIFNYQIKRSALSIYLFVISYAVL